MSIDILARLSLLQDAQEWLFQTEPTDMMERLDWLATGVDILERLGGDPEPDAGQANQNDSVSAMLQAIQPYMNSSQYQAISDAQAMQANAEQIKALFSAINSTPALYSQDGKGRDAIAYLHYFSSASDWYVTEKESVADDVGDAFGLAVINQDWNNSELGYMSIKEMLATGKIELDFNFEQKALNQIESSGTTGVVRPADTVDGVERVKLSDEEKASLYAFSEEGVTKGQRQKDNKEAVDILMQFSADILMQFSADILGLPVASSNSDAATVLTAEQQIKLSKYSGNGGGLTDFLGRKGSDYEYYTPKPIADAMWNLMRDLGFSGGSVLDPASGTGIFGATAPANVVMQSVELDSVSGGINKLLNSSDTHNVLVSNFEKFAANSDDEAFDCVITNVPFSSQKNARGSNYKDDPKYQDESLDAYFILRSLEKLRAGGLAAFVVPTRFVSGLDQKSQFLRIRTLLQADFLGAWRLPNKVFGNAGTNVATDIIVFKKYSKSVRESIMSAYDSGSMDMLYESRVLDSSIVEGHYFRDEGVRFVIGEFQAKDKNKMRDVDKYLTDKSVTDIAKMIQKFPDSRVDLSVFDGVEVKDDAAVYEVGSVIVKLGQSYEMQADGTWKPLKSKDVSQDMLDLRSKYATANSALGYGLGYGLNFDRAFRYYKSESIDNMPEWFAKVCRDLSKEGIPEAQRDGLFKYLICAYAVQEAIQQHGLQDGFDYTTGNYSDLSWMMAKNKKAIKSASKSKYLSQDNKNVLARSFVVYNQDETKKIENQEDAFSLAWLGKNKQDTEIVLSAELNTRNRYERLRYVNKSPTGVSVEEMRKIDPEFNIMTNDDFCISPDGNVLHADDYFVGSVYDVQDKIKKQIDDPNTSAEVKDKLVRQLALSEQRYTPIDTSRMNFDLLSRYVPIQMKTRYLREYVSSDLAIQNKADGGFEYVLSTKQYDTNFNSRAWRQQYVALMVGRYVATGGELRVTVRNLQENEKAVVLKEIMDAVKKADFQFNAWVKSQPDFIAKLQHEANSPENLTFDVSDDTEPLVIDGFNPPFELNGYQNSEIRRMTRYMAGITGFDVGLGKTTTALGSVQHMHNIGAKKKTLFLIPNTVLSNWRREAQSAYQSLDDCLFVGLDYNEKKQKYEVDSGNYGRDIMLILNNQHKKIFMSYEALIMIPLMKETLNDYEEHLAMTDSAFGAFEMKRAKEERQKARLSRMLESPEAGNMPYFEMLGIDSIVTDEAQNFKNGKSAATFKAAKNLSMPEESKRALDLAVKKWFVMDGNPAGDGVMDLTATPITNSPLEIYSMLSAAVGEDVVNRGMLNIKGADAFLETFAEVENRAYEGVDGEMRSGRVFVGLKNVDVLKSMLHKVANIRTASEEKLPIPEADTQRVTVAIDKETVMLLELMKEAYRQEGKINLIPKSVIDQVEAAGLKDQFDQLSDGNSQTLRNPLTLCMEMASLSVEGKSSVLRISKFGYSRDQMPLVEKLVAQFNKKGVKIKETRKSIAVDPADILKNRIDPETGNQVLEIRSSVKIDGDNIILNNNSYQAQKVLIDMAEKLGIFLNPELSPKVLAMLDNFKKELADPRHKKQSKQLIFCDNLSMHQRIKLALINQCGVPSSKIAIINGAEIKDPIQMQDIQDGFNADLEENVYTVVILNKKGETGINLQKGTQALHHLTIGWTPDSIQQRDGRGKRQGNVLDSIRIYHYDQQGTFDEYKRNLVNAKASWIDAVMSRDKTDNSVEVVGKLTRSDYEALIEATGDAEAISRIEKARREKDLEERQKAQQERYEVIREFLDSTMSSIGSNSSLKKSDVYGEFFLEAHSLHKKITDGRKRLQVAVAKDSLTTQEVTRRTIELKALDARLDEMSNQVAEDLADTKYSDLRTFLDDIDSVATSRVKSSTSKRNLSNEVKNSAANIYTSITGGKARRTLDSLVELREQSEARIIENIKAEFIQLYPTLTPEKADKLAQGKAMLTKEGVYAEAGFIGVLDDANPFSYSPRNMVIFVDKANARLRCIKMNDRGFADEMIADAPTDRALSGSVYQRMKAAYSPTDAEYQSIVESIAVSDLGMVESLKSELYTAYKQQTILSGYFPELEPRFQAATESIVDYFNLETFAPNGIKFPYLFVFNEGVTAEGTGLMVNKSRKREVTKEELIAKYGADSLIAIFMGDCLDKGYPIIKSPHNLYFKGKSKDTSALTGKKNPLALLLSVSKAYKPKLTGLDLQSIGIKGIDELIEDGISLFDAQKDVTSELDDVENIKEWLADQLANCIDFVEPDFFKENVEAYVNNSRMRNIEKFSAIHAEIKASQDRGKAGNLSKILAQAEAKSVNGFVGYCGVNLSDSFYVKNVFYRLCEAERYKQKGRPSEKYKGSWEWTVTTSSVRKFIESDPERAAKLVIIDPFVSELQRK